MIRRPAVFQNQLSFKSDLFANNFYHDIQNVKHSNFKSRFLEASTNDLPNIFKTCPDNDESGSVFRVLFKTFWIFKFGSAVLEIWALKVQKNEFFRINEWSSCQRIFRTLQTSQANDLTVAGFAIRFWSKNTYTDSSLSTFMIFLNWSKQKLSNISEAFFPEKHRFLSFLWREENYFLYFNV